MTPSRLVPNAGRMVRRYSAFIETLVAASTDNLDFLKDKALRCMADLLAAKPEGEARLLAALVNKLGDPSRKLASKVGPDHMCLRCLPYYQTKQLFLYAAFSTNLTSLWSFSRSMILPVQLSSSCASP